MNNDLVKDVPDSSGVITRYIPGVFEQVHHEGSSALNPVLKNVTATIGLPLKFTDLI